MIHCSAGVGRTGTFMVVDTMLQRINKERDVDVFGCVSMLRTQRMSMVQTQVGTSFQSSFFLWNSRNISPSVSSFGLQRSVQNVTV